jgi:hypothetical protein
LLEAKDELDGSCFGIVDDDEDDDVESEDEDGDEFAGVDSGTFEWLRMIAFR